MQRRVFLRACAASAALAAAPVEAARGLKARSYERTQLVDPQKRPLAAARLVAGDAFFAKYELRLELDYGSGRARQRTGARAVVMDLGSFCRQ